MSESNDDVEVTVVIHLRNFINDDDLGPLTLREIVTALLEEEGALSFIDGSIPGPDAHILDVKRWQS